MDEFAEIESAADELRREFVKLYGDDPLDVSGDRREEMFSPYLFGTNEVWSQ